MKLKLKMSINILATIKKCLNLVLVPVSQNGIMIQTNYSKMKDKTGGVAIEEFVGLKPKMIRFWQMTIASIK